MASDDPLLIHCHHCNARVQLNVERVLQKVHFDDDTHEALNGERVSLGCCAVCSNILVGIQKLLEYEVIGEYGEADETWAATAERIWPDPESPLSASIPVPIHASLTEAIACLNCGATTASVAMSGRALEAIARHFTKKPNPERLLLWAGINELHDEKVIDDRLFSWAKELHEHRNLAAHASGMSFSREDAEDLLNFAVAICEYVFVVQEKYDLFVRRKENKKASGA